MRCVGAYDPAVRSLARLAARLTRHRVPYCAVGGFATAMYVPLRRVRDLDVVLAPTALAGRRAEAAIASLVADPCVVVDPSDALVTAELLTAGAQAVVPTSWGTLHILGAVLPDGCDRADLVRRRRWFVVRAGLPVAASDVESLIRLKTLAGHGRDAEDVLALRARIRGLRLAP